MMSAPTNQKRESPGHVGESMRGETTPAAIACGLFELDAGGR
jgi:hypothetical protein